jgi:nucleotide-binding universal stress UspA family protein
MEQILVGIDYQHGGWEALARACTLAKRIDARLHVLLVRPETGNGAADEAHRALALRRHLELRIETAKAQGIRVDYFITDGRYEDEIVRFVNKYRITLLVYQLRDGESGSTEKAGWSLQAIRHRIACKVEIVAPRKRTV